MLSEQTNNFGVDLLRAELKTDSPRAAELKRIMQSGGLVSNDIILDMLESAMLPL